MNNGSVAAGSAEAEGARVAFLDGAPANEEQNFFSAGLAAAAFRATDREAEVFSCAENTRGAWGAERAQEAESHAPGTWHWQLTHLAHGFDSATGCTCTNAEQKTVNKIHVMCFMAGCTIAVGGRSANVIPVTGPWNAQPPLYPPSRRQPQPAPSQAQPDDFPLRQWPPPGSS